MGKLFRKTILKTNSEDCWDFFSSPENLALITPGEMDFTITEFDGKKMYEGQRISYTLRPLKGLKVKWTTEIKSVKDGREFVDTQLVGPYKLWHHRHIFKEVENGIEMIDVVHYELPFGFLGRLAEKMIVRKKVEAIFDYRSTVIDGLFAKKKDHQVEYMT